MVTFNNFFSKTMTNLEDYFLNVEPIRDYINNAKITMIVISFNVPPFKSIILDDVFLNESPFIYGYYLTHTFGETSIQQYNLWGDDKKIQQKIKSLSSYILHNITYKEADMNKIKVPYKLKLDYVLQEIKCHCGHTLISNKCPNCTSFWDIAPIIKTDIPYVNDIRSICFPKNKEITCTCKSKKPCRHILAKLQKEKLKLEFPFQLG